MGKAIKFWTQVIHLWTPESPSASECMMSQIFHNRAINLHLNTFYLYKTLHQIQIKPIFLDS